MKLNTKPLKKEQQKHFIKSPNLYNLNDDWLTKKGGGRAGRPMQGMGTPTYRVRHKFGNQNMKMSKMRSKYCFIPIFLVLS